MTAAATAAGTVPAGDPILGELDRFTRHRLHNRPIGRPLMQDAETREVGRSILNCSQRLELLLQSDGERLGATRLTGADLCNRRLCPFCEWRRTRVWRKRILSGLEGYLQDNPKRIPVFLTLTVRNCAIDDLRQTIRDIHAAWHRMTRESWFPSDAWIRRTEITASGWSGEESTRRSGGRSDPPMNRSAAGVGSVHPHVHALLMVRPSYFGRDYVKHGEWRAQWMHHARLDYVPVVDIRKGYLKPVSPDSGPVSPVAAVMEAAKYAAKATDLAKFGPLLPALHFQLKGLRLYGLSQELSRYIKASEVTAGELTDAPSEGDERFPLKFSCIAEWIDSVQEYRIAP